MTKLEKERAVKGMHEEHEIYIHNITVQGKRKDDERRLKATGAVVVK